MAEYLRETMDSVLSQDYPNIEYIVMDGGSTDGTVAILESYRNRLQYFSGSDAGTADAINQGFQKSSGSILAWLNADDTYLPGAVKTAVERLSAEPDAAAVYGQGYWVDSDGTILRPYPTRTSTAGELGYECCICQPTCFIRRSAFEEAGKLDATLQLAFDYDLWIRLSKHHHLTCIPEYVATSRMHARGKTLRDRRQVFQEGFRVLKRHFGYVPFQWIYGYACYLLDKRDQFYDPLEPSIPGYVLSLFLGVRHNRDRLARYCREWYGIMTYAGFLRMWRRSGLARMLGRARS